MLDKLPGMGAGLRDRALVLVGFAGGFRRSEVVALAIADLEFNSAGLIVTLGRAKTDQEGRSPRLGIPYGSTEKTCPVRSVRAWLKTAASVSASAECRVAGTKTPGIWAASWPGPSALLSRY